MQCLIQALQPQREGTWALRLPVCGLLTIYFAETQAASQAGEALELWWTGQCDVLHCSNACVIKHQWLKKKGSLLLETEMVGASSQCIVNRRDSQQLL